MDTREPHDLILVGSSFASTFFLLEYLEHAAADARVLVLERGAIKSHSWLTANQDAWIQESQDLISHERSDKVWGVRVAFGGASNAWWACAPRMMPEDFELFSRYGVGQDWPVTYDELEAFYDKAETIMAVSGPDATPYPRSKPYPQPAHRFSDVDRILEKAYGDQFLAMPSARARVATPRGRARCCAAGVCNACPIDSKFTVSNELMHLYEDPRVELVLGARVDAVEIQGQRATGVRYTRSGKEQLATGEFVALGASAMFNPHILLRSGLNEPALGAGLNQQEGVFVYAHLDGVDNFSGSTSITGHGYNFYTGPHRARRAGCLIETWNIPMLRNERGKYRQFLQMKLIFENEREIRNRIVVDPDDPTRPVAIHNGLSPRTSEGINAVKNLTREFLQPLPVEAVVHMRRSVTEDHNLGTVVMGDHPADSVVDRHLVHHKIRNLAVLGSSAFPTSAPANPTLTLCALSLWSASHLFGRRPS